MSFIDMPMDIEDVTEPKAGPEGDYQLMISGVKCKLLNDTYVAAESWAQAPEPLKGLLVICEPISGPVGVNIEDVTNVLHNVSLPIAGDDQEKVKNKMLFVKRFLMVFGIPMNGTQLDPTAFIGKQAKCHLIQDNYNDTISNKIKLPNLR